MRELGRVPGGGPLPTVELPGEVVPAAPDHLRPQWPYGPGGHRVVQEDDPLTRLQHAGEPLGVLGGRLERLRGRGGAKPRAPPNETGQAPESSPPPRGEDPPGGAERGRPPGGHGAAGGTSASKRPL